MRSLRPRPFAVGLFVSSALLVGGLAWGCNVPVFRYALEHWRPDPYRLTVFHREPLSAEEQDRLAVLAQRNLSHANVVVRTLDVNRLDEVDRPLFASLAEQPLPRLVVQYPAALGLDEPVWTGGLGSDDLAALLDSPARRELVRRLADGETAVWVLLTTGDAAQDDAAAALLTDELQALSRKLKLPELTESPEDILLGSAPLKVSFSLLEVSRNNLAERALVAMLLGCESDLAPLKEPMVFPVFGRGRALLPLIGAGISGDNIHTSAAFLTGACSCQVKNQNPGFDLLHTADWATLLVLDQDPAIAMSEDASPGEPELVPIPSGVPAPPEESPVETSATAPTTSAAPPRSFPLTRVALMAAVVGAVAVAVCWRR
uniref:Uncharacterized protein n=1 Tax=Schlesneria paludicola TaxID=360056 RepID=A0A7C2K208_9PLAN